MFFPSFRRKDTHSILGRKHIKGEPHQLAEDFALKESLGMSVITSRLLPIRFLALFNLFNSHMI